MARTLGWSAQKLWKSTSSPVNAAGCTDPDIVAGMPIVLFTKIDEAKDAIAQQLTVYGQLLVIAPCWTVKASGPADSNIVGDENQLRGQIKRFEDMGVTDFNAAIMDVKMALCAHLRLSW